MSLWDEIVDGTSSIGSNLFSQAVESATAAGTQAIQEKLGPRVDRVTPMQPAPQSPPLFSTKNNVLIAAAIGLVVLLIFLRMRR